MDGGKSPVNFAARKGILRCKDSGRPVYAINGEREVPGRQKVVRGSNIPVLISHAGLNPRSKSSNESSFAGELLKIKYKKQKRRRLAKFA